jgi:hypothetical protein
MYPKAKKTPFSWCAGFRTNDAVRLHEKRPPPFLMIFNPVSLNEIAKDYSFAGLVKKDDFIHTSTTNNQLINLGFVSLWTIGVTYIIRQYPVHIQLGGNLFASDEESIFHQHFGLGKAIFPFLQKDIVQLIGRNQIRHWTTDGFFHFSCQLLRQWDNGTLDPAGYMWFQRQPATNIAAAAAAKKANHNASRRIGKAKKVNYRGPSIIHTLGAKGTSCDGGGLLVAAAAAVSECVVILYCDKYS